MPTSAHQRKSIEKRKTKALKLYNEGLTTREVGHIVKRSHTWVANTVNELSPVVDN